MMPNGASRLPPVSPRWSVVLWGAAYLAIAGLLQVNARVPWDADTSYHVAVARLLRAHGILHAFPWTPFSWLSDHYADKELLFHLVMAPFAGLDWTACAHVAGTLVGAATLFCSYLVLRSERVPGAGVWALLPLCASLVYAFRFTLVRPHVVSVALALVVLWAAARRAYAVLAVASALYPWAYVGWYLAIVLGVVAESARLAARKRPIWRTLAVVLVSLALGIALHPNGLDLFRLAWLVNVKLLIGTAWAGTPGLELGEEFRHFTLYEWWRYLGAAALATGVSLAVSWRRRATDSVGLAFALGALAFGLLTLFTARFAEYFVPFAILSLALASRHVRWRPFTAAVTAGFLLYQGGPLVGLLRGLREREELIPDDVAAYLQARIPAGSQVFSCGWLLTGTMMLALPERKFIVALDPTLFFFKDPALYRLWFSIPRQPPPDLDEVIRKAFGARYVMCLRERRFEEFFERLESGPGVQTVLSSRFWKVYELPGRE
ncbi:MAG TPA: hypothetical protein VMT17_12725 [Anaeromyxobacteraceae bacterium]|nr:hypothetical protein [Anaeromyxobacteraceae bacterium]